MGESFGSQADQSPVTTGITSNRWYWKSTRTNPIGQADDKWLGLRSDPLDTLGAHYADARDGGGDERNMNESRDGPAFVNAKDPQVAFILAGQETSVDVSKLSPGTVVPGYILAPYMGSRGDVQARGFWSGGKWTLVLVRALNTGHQDDLVFVPQKPVPFGVALSDNDGGLSHLVVADDVLTLQWK